MQEENFLKVRDISKKLSTPHKEPITSPLSPKRVESPVNLENQGRGKRIRTLTTPCKLAGCHTASGNILRHAARILDFDGDLQFFGNSFEAPPASDDAIPDDGDPDYIDESEPKQQKPEPKTPRPNFEHVIALQERLNTPDTQVALWWNIVSL